MFIHAQAQFPSQDPGVVLGWEDGVLSAPFTSPVPSAQALGREEGNQGKQTASLPQASPSKL